MNAARGARRWPVVEAIALGAAVAFLAGVGALQQTRRGHDTSDSYSSFDAGPGGFRAWYELLGREGVAVARFEERLPFLDRSVRVLVVGDPPPSPSRVPEVTPADGTALAAWVRDGGHLVVVGRGFEALFASDPLRLPAESWIDRSTAFVAPELRRFGVRSVDARLGARLTARKTDRVLLRDARGALALRYPLGRGEVVDVADGSLVRNADIDRPDRARFAFALAALSGAGRGATVAFDEALHGYAAPEHWWQVVPRRFVVAVALASIVLGIGLAGAAIRLGPPSPGDSDRAPNSAEYLDALVALMERAHAADASLREALMSARRALVVRFGMPADATAAALAACIDEPGMRAGFMELTAAAIAGGVADPALVRGVAVARALRKEYGADARGA